ncbi:MAG: PAS domain S-box protein [Methanosarcina sp.]
MEEKLGIFKSGVVNSCVTENIAWGAHFCLFYNIRDNLYEIIAQYFKAGLENSEFCVWILPEHIDAREAKQALGKIIPDFDACVEKNQIEILSSVSWSEKNRNSNLKKSSGFGIEKLKDSFSRNFSGLRLVQDMVRSKEEGKEKGKDSFIAYEKNLDNLIFSSQVRSLCTYSLEKYNSTEIFDIIAAHEFSLIRKEGNWECIGISKGRNIAEFEENKQNKQAEEILRESEERFRLLIETVAQAVWETNAEGEAVTDSPSWRAYTGQTLEEWLGYGWANAVHPDDREYAERQWGEAVTANRNVNAEFRLKNPSGEWRWTNVLAAPIRDYEGRVSKWVGMNIDITERKRAEEMLRKSEEQQAYLLKLSDALKDLNDPEEIQSAASRVLGEHIHADRVPYAHVINEQEVVITVDYVNGVSSIAGTLHTSDFSPMITDAYKQGRWVIFNDISTDPRFTQAEREAYKAINVVSNASLGLVKDGKWVATFGAHSAKPRVWTEFELKLISETAERIWGAFERALAEEALQESEEKYRQIVETAQEGIWLINGNDETVFVNRKLTELFGYSPEEMLGQSPQKFMAPEFHFLAKEKLSEHVQGINHIMDYRFIRKDGSDLWCILSSSSLLDEQGKYAGSLAMLTDITARKKVEKALQQSEFRYRTLFSSIDEGFCIIEVLFNESKKPVDYRFLETNPAFEKQTGLINATGKRMRKLAPGHEEHWFETYGQIALTGQPARFQNRAEQLHRWYDVYAFRYEEPEKRQVAILFNDITKSKQTEETLRERENQLAAFLEQIPVGLGLFNTQGRWVLKNKIFQQFVSDVIPSQDPENGWRWKAWGPDGRLLEKSEWPGARALQGEKVDWLDMLYTTDEGLEIWTRVSSVPFRNQAGEIKGVISIIQDIDKQKRVEQALQRSETRLRKLYESGLIGVIYFTLEGQIIDANDKYLEMVGYTREDLKAQRINWKEMTPPEYEALDEYAVNELRTTGVDTPYEKEYIRKDGSRVPIIIGAAMTDEACSQGIAFVLDIMERKQEEHTIRRYYNKLEAINKVFASAVQADTEEDLGNACLSVALKLTDSQVGFIAEIGTDGLLHEIAISNMGWDQCLMYDRAGHRNMAENFGLQGLYGSVIRSGKSFFTNNPPSHPDSIGLPEGHPPLTSFLGVPFILNGKAKGILAVVNREGGYTREQQEDLEDIAPAVMQALEKRKAEKEREQAQQALKEAYENAEEKVKTRTSELERAYNSLKENERRLSEAQRMAHIGYWDWDILNDKLYWSEEMYRIFGLAPQGFGANYGTFLNSVHPEDRAFVDNAVKKALTGMPFAVDYRILTPAEGEERIVFAQGKVFFNNKNDPVLMRGTVQDITEKREAEKAFLNSVAARKKEIHHRIKNNLQVISSLLDLQAEKFANKECLDNSEIFEAFRESQERVASIALIHEELHEGGGNDTLNFSQYLEKLTEHLFKTYRFGKADICLNMDLQEDIFFDMDTAVPLGIIVNELVSNSLKYAFSGKKEGEIRITLYREEEEDCEENRIKRINQEFKSPERSMRYKLIVSDNGIGIPESINLEDSNTLGIQLVTILVDQLDGELELNRESGTEFIISVPVTKKY